MSFLKQPGFLIGSMGLLKRNKKHESDKGK
jgi:hypothetical protein